MSEYTFDSLKKFAPIFFGSQGPVLFSLGIKHPLSVISNFLMIGLLRASLNQANAPTNNDALDKLFVQNRLKNLVITSNGNRALRIALGTSNLMAAILYTIRCVRRNKSESNESKWFDLPKEWTLTGLMCMFSGVWLSSGYYGQ